MTIDVILCTYNRCEILEEVLASVAASVVPSSIVWSVIVVDNNSSDRTQEVVTGFRDRYPHRFRYVFEPESGKSYALNTGIRESHADVLAFLDDDVTVESSWLFNLVAPLADDTCSGVGGRTLPKDAFAAPSWLAMSGPYSMGGILCANFDLGDVPCTLSEPPYGANMAFRRTMFEKYGGFRTDMGPSPRTDVPRPNEDTEFGRRLLAAGERLTYAPSAVVYHPVPSGRVTKEYFLRWWFDYGRAQIREKGRQPSAFGIVPRYCLSIPRLIGTHLTVRIFRWLATFSPQVRFFRKTEVWRTVGMIVESYRDLMSRADKNGCEEFAIPRFESANTNGERRV